MILKMILKTIILFCIFLLIFFAFNHIHPCLDNLPEEIKVKIIEQMKLPADIRLNHSFDNIFEKFVKGEYSQEIIKKSWDLEYKLPLIYEKYQKGDEAYKKRMPVFIQKIFKEYNYSNKFFKNSIPFIIYHNIPRYPTIYVDYTDTIGGVSQHCFDISAIIKENNTIEKINDSSFIDLNIVTIFWTLSSIQDNRSEYENCLKNIADIIQKDKNRILCVNIQGTIDENNKDFCVNYLKKLSEICTISVKAEMRPFCIYHNIPIVLPPTYYRKKDVFDPLIKRFFECQTEKEFLSIENFWSAFNNEKKLLDEFFSFCKLLNALDINFLNTGLNYVHVLQKFNGYFSPCEGKMFNHASAKNIKPMLKLYEPLCKRSNLNERLWLFKINMKKYVDRMPFCVYQHGVIIQDLIKDILEFGNEKLIFGCYKFIIKKSPNAHDLILKLLEYLYTPHFLTKAGISLTQDLKLNFLSIGGKKTSQDLRLRLYKCLIDVIEIKETKEFKDLSLAIADYLIHFPQPWSSKNIEILRSIIKQYNLGVGYVKAVDAYIKDYFYFFETKKSKSILKTNFLPISIFIFLFLISLKT